MRVTTNTPTESSVVERNTRTDRAKAKEVETPEKKHPAPKNANIEISESARMMKGASDAVREVPNINWERVNDLKSRIESGKYHIDSGTLADKILQDHLNTDFGKNNL